MINQLKVALFSAALLVSMNYSMTLQEVFDDPAIVHAKKNLEEKAAQIAAKSTLANDPLYKKYEAINLCNRIRVLDGKKNLILLGQMLQASVESIDELSVADQSFDQYYQTKPVQSLIGVWRTLRTLRDIEMQEIATYHRNPSTPIVLQEHADLSAILDSFEQLVVTIATKLKDVPVKTITNAITFKKLQEEEPTEQEKKVSNALFYTFVIVGICRQWMHEAQEFINQKSSTFTFNTHEIEEQIAQLDRLVAQDSPTTKINIQAMRVILATIEPLIHALRTFVAQRESADVRPEVIKFLEKYDTLLALFYGTDELPDGVASDFQTLSKYVFDILIKPEQIQSA